MCENKDCQHKKESPIKDWKHRCKFGSDGKRLQNGTVIVGWNDLATTHPRLAKECLDDPTEFTGGSAKRKTWECSVCGHKWPAPAVSRTMGFGCKPCGSKRVGKKLSTVPYEKSVAYLFPHLVGEHRGPSDLRSIGPGSASVENWECSVCGHEWPSPVVNRTRLGAGCKPCGHKRTGKKRSTVPYKKSAAYLFPHLVREHRGPGDLRSLGPGSDSMENWECDDCGHKWPSTVCGRTRGQGCKPCAHRRRAKNQSIVPYKKSVAYLFPHLVKSHRGPSDLGSISPGSGFIENWECEECGHKWPSPVGNRVRGRGCSHCAKRGHDRSGASFVYLICRPGQIQYGIMNIWTNRLKQHARKGWELLDKIEVTGETARSLETKIKQTLRAKGIPVGREAFREKFEGWSEAFQEVDLYVRSIRGLCRKLGIDLDAFLAA